MHRARTKSDDERETLSYPLLDLRLTRQDCIRIIEQSDLPVPPKSACFFCPYHSKKAWTRLAKDEPELFSKSVALERHLSERSQRLGHGPLFLTDAMIPLDLAIVDVGQTELDFTGLDMCESGYCMT
ncbi:MAG: hypothetical protein LC793_21185 [Thermomicrobia bacterium]|nr:hypothetical protein [Thermomicrobia bacterium]